MLIRVKQKSSEKVARRKPRRIVPEEDFWGLYEEKLILLCERLHKEECPFSFKLCQRQEGGENKKQVVIEEKNKTILLTVSYYNIKALLLLNNFKDEPKIVDVLERMYELLIRTKLFSSFSFRIHRPA